MSEVKRVAADNCPDFGFHDYQGISLEVFLDERWQPFQLFYFDWMLDKEQKYYIQNFEDIKGYEVLGKVPITRNSDTILWAVESMLRVKAK